MKKVCLWLYLLNKRLYRKVIFVCLLLLIPVLVFSFYGAAGETGGIVTVALAQEDPADLTADSIISRLIGESRVIVFQRTSPEHAVELVKTGKADGAWIFPENTASHIAGFATGENSGFIRVIEREDNVPLRLAREKLSGAVYAPTVRNVYLQYLRQYAPETEAVSDEALLSYLEKTHVNGELFAFYDANGNPREHSGNFLLTPLRGLLATIMVICSPVTAMYYRKDRDAGKFSLLPERYGVLTEFAYQAVSAANMMAVILISLLCTGLHHNLWQELVLTVLYGLCCCLMGMLLRRIFRSILAAVMPGLLVVLLIGSPVFFDFAAMRSVSLLLPPTYFIQGGYNRRYLLYLAAYDFILVGIILLWERIRKIKFRKT